MPWIGWFHFESSLLNESVSELVDNSRVQALPLAADSSTPATAGAPSSSHSYPRNQGVGICANSSEQAHPSCQSSHSSMHMLQSAREELEGEDCERLPWRSYQQSSFARTRLAKLKCGLTPGTTPNVTLLALKLTPGKTRLNPRAGEP